MQKRSFQQFSNDSSRVEQAIARADELLHAAKALRDDLAAIRHEPDRDVQVHGIIKTRNDQLQPAVRWLEDNEHLSGEAIPQGGSAKRARETQTAMPVPTPTMLTRFALSDVPAGDHALPPLPSISDKRLELESLTHIGAVSSNSGSANYERLEWLGDAYLQVMATAYIYNSFPDQSPGRCAQLRERLVRNEALAKFTIHYGLLDVAHLPADLNMAPAKRGIRRPHHQEKTAAEKTAIKVCGDLFESYVAALVLDGPDGTTRLASWLKAIFASILSDELTKQFKSESEDQPRPQAPREVSTGQPPPPNAKVALAQMIGAKGITIAYEDIGEPRTAKNLKVPWFSVGVFLTGWGETRLQLGWGGGLSKKDAGMQAAQRAIDNKKLMGKFVKMKQDFLAARAPPEAPETMQKAE